MESRIGQMLCFLLVLATVGAISSARFVCPVNSQKFVSTNRSLLPLENIQSSSESRFNPTTNFVNRGDGDSPWCTASNLPSVSGQYVELNFTEPVVVAMLMSGGFVSTYVDNFTLHYTMSSTEENFEVYGQLKSEQEFLVPNLETANVNFVLGEQILARRLRFVVNEGMLNERLAVCWKVLLFGCKMNEAQELMNEVSQTTITDSPATTESPTSLPVTTNLVTTNSPSEPNVMNCLNQQKQNQDNVLLIILPAIIAIILIIIVIVSVLLCICYMRTISHKRLEYKPPREGIRMKESIDNGTTTPSSANFHYDNPRFLCYDVPRSSIRSRQHSESLSTLGSVAEIKNPVYAAKKNLQDYAEPTYHLPADATDGNDYEDIPGSPPTELERRTFSNTTINSGSYKSPPSVPSEPPKLPGSGVTLDGPRSPTNPANNVLYSQVYKMRSKEKDEMENEAEHEASCSPPVIDSQCISSSSNALVQEIDRLVSDLENSRAIAKQW